MGPYRVDVSTKIEIKKCLIRKEEGQCREENVMHVVKKKMCEEGKCVLTGTSYAQAVSMVECLAQHVQLVHCVENL